MCRRGCRSAIRQSRIDELADTRIGDSAYEPAVVERIIERPGIKRASCADTRPEGVHRNGRAESAGRLVLNHIIIINSRKYLVSPTAPVVSGGMTMDPEPTFGMSVMPMKLDDGLGETTAGAGHWGRRFLPLALRWWRSTSGGVTGE